MKKSVKHKFQYLLFFLLSMPAFIFASAQDVYKRQGYRCIKLKIGAINFEEELALLRHIRAHYSAREIELRVDVYKRQVYGIGSASFPPIHSTLTLLSFKPTLSMFEKSFRQSAVE